MPDRIATFEGFYVAALEWGHYARITDMQRRGFRISPLRDTFEAIADDPETADAYRAAAEDYATYSTFDAYDWRSPRAQLA